MPISSWILEAYREEDWEEVSARIKLKFSFRCAVCLCKGKLQLHHVVYNGYEKDWPHWAYPDYYLRPVCHQCNKPCGYLFFPLYSPPLTEDEVESVWQLQLKVACASLGISRPIASLDYSLDDIPPSFDDDDVPF